MKNKKRKSIIFILSAGLILSSLLACKGLPNVKDAADSLSDIKGNEKSSKKKATFKENVLSQEELDEIKKDLSHMEYNYLLGVEFNDPEELDWDKVYAARKTQEFIPDKYNFISGKKLGSSYSLTIEPVLEDENDVDERINNPRRTIFATKNGSVYKILYNKFDWEYGCSETVDVDIKNYDGDVKIVAFYGNDEQNSHLILTVDGVRKAKLSEWIYSDDEYYDINAIKEVASFDINKDCISDLIIIGDTEDGEHISVQLGWLSDFDDEIDDYEHMYNLSEGAEEYLAGDYSVDGVKEYLLLNNWAGEEYASYKDAYVDLVDKLESDNGSDGSYLYALAKLDEDKIPELVYTKDESQFVYTYKDGKLGKYEGDVENVTPENNYAEILNSLNAKKDKVTTLKGFDDSTNYYEEVNFSAGVEDYTFTYDDDGWGYGKAYLTDGINTVVQEEMPTVSRIYLIERGNGQKFLMVVTNCFLYESSIYVYNLNGSRVLKPKLFDSSFSLYNGDIKDTRSFDLFNIQTVFGVTGTCKNFFMGIDGLPKTNEEVEYYVSNSTMDDGNKIIKQGEKTKLKTDFSFQGWKNLEDEDNPEEMELKKGTELTLYLTNGEVVIFKTDDGKYVGVGIYDEDDEDSEEDEDIPYIEDVFENIPMLVDEDDLWLLD